MHSYNSCAYLTISGSASRTTTTTNTAATTTKTTTIESSTPTTATATNTVTTTTRTTTTIIYSYDKPYWGAENFYGLAVKVLRAMHHFYLYFSVCFVLDGGDCAGYRDGPKWNIWGPIGHWWEGHFSIHIHSVYWRRQRRPTLRHAVWLDDAFETHHVIGQCAVMSREIGRCTETCHVIGQYVWDMPHDWTMYWDALCDWTTKCATWLDSVWPSTKSLS